MRKPDFEEMRKNSDNWKLGIVYFCSDDPRVIVRQRLPLGWTWNFANRWALPGIFAAFLVFAGPAVLAWYMGIRSATVFGSLFIAGLCLVMLVAHKLSRDPSESRNASR